VCMKQSISIVFLIACGGSEPAPQAPVASAPVASPPVATQAPAVPSAPTIDVVQVPAPIATLSKVACVYTSDMPGAVPLRLTNSGAPFASLTNSKSVKFSLAAGSGSEGAFVEADVGPAVLRGRVAEASFNLYPQSASVVKGFLVPESDTAVKLVKTDVDSVTFAPVFSSERLTTADSDLAESRPCAFFALTRKAFNTLSATGGEPRGTVALRPGKVELKKELNGGVVATLTTDDRSPMATLLASSGNQKRVAWTSSGALVFGWVPSKSIIETGGLGLSGTGAGGVQPLTNPGIPAWTRVKCTEDLPLVGEVGKDRSEVGTIKKGKFFQIGPDQQGWRGVAFPDSPARNGDNGRLVVPSMKTAGCGA
jgi:hypothetical protein